MQRSPATTAPRRPRFWARVVPALVLLVLSPLVAEFLLGDFSVRSLYVLAYLVPLYGGGALLIREVTRRSGRGWPTLVLLAIAYGIFEEGVTTMSLFNPDYVGQHLLRYGFIPALGTSFDWDVFVVGIHVVFSISTPILIAEGVAGRWRTEPWLRNPGLGITAALFLLGAALTTGVQILSSHFVASTPQLMAVGVLVVILAVTAFTAFRRTARSTSGRSPASVWLAFPAVLALLSAFEVVQKYVSTSPAPPWLTVMLLVALLVAVGAVVAHWSRQEGWTPMGYLAVAAGAVGTYGWVSLAAFAEGHTDLGASTGPVDVAGQVVLILVVFGLIALGVRRSLGRRPIALPTVPVAREAAPR